MKNVVLSADGERMVYCVPDQVADDLRSYCLEFVYGWLQTSPDAEKYRIMGGVIYNEEDFIDYLNKWIFPEEPSTLVENLGWIDFGDPLPEPYTDCAEYNF